MFGSSSSTSTSAQDSRNSDSTSGEGDPTLPAEAAPLSQRGHPSTAGPTLNTSSAGVGSIPTGLNLDTNDDHHSPLSPNSPPDASKADKRRRSSGIAKAGALFATAKQSLHLSSSNSQSNNTSSTLAAPLTPHSSVIQSLGKSDPALIVPQGSLNNSAGESKHGKRSTFRVGVTEDKNKKCRRTMEDTHSYLYNFLSTPAPQLPGQAEVNAEDTDEGVASTPVEQAEGPIVETDNGYFAVFDGHAGTFAADWCGKKLHILLEDIIRKNPNTPIPELLDQAFTTADQQLDKLPLKNSGCTAICAVLRWEDRIPSRDSATGSTSIAPAAIKVIAEAADAATTSTEGQLLTGSDSLHNTDDTLARSPATATSSKLNPASALATSPQSATTLSPLPRLRNKATRQRVLYTANVGDARIVLCRNGKALRLSYDHKGSDEHEGRRISNAGGLILNNRVNGVLAVTRALGDTYMKDLVTGHPYTTETVIQPESDEFLILACDGLWDVCSDQEAVDHVRNVQDVQLASKMLVDHALSRFSTDNLSCMIVRFDSKPSSPIGVDGDPPSLVKGGISEADHIVSEARKSLIPDEGSADTALSSSSKTIPVAGQEGTT